MAKILVIGGTNFMGYFAVEYALSRGHEVTLFSRGKSNPGAFPLAEHIRGDRAADIELLDGHKWDAVLDTCGYIPRIVRKSLDVLKDAVGLYVFISTMSVYSETPPTGVDENSAVSILPDPAVEEITGETYGGLKVLCEKAVQEVMTDHALIIRPGLIVGPRDPTYRFDYWPDRVANGGEVLAPGKPDDPVQFIDARDLGEWVVRMIEGHRTGVFNAIGPADPLTMESLLTTCKQVSGSDATVTWLDDQFLLERNVTPWQELPLWLPEEAKGLHRSSNARAVATGLTYRPRADTV